MLLQYKGNYLEPDEEAIIALCLYLGGAPDDGEYPETQYSSMTFTWNKDGFSIIF